MSKRGAVCHVRDCVGFDYRLSIDIPPDLPGMAVYDLVGHRRQRKLVNVQPLLDDLACVRWLHCSVRATVPNRQLRPDVAIWRSLPHQIAQLAGGSWRSLEHAAQRFLSVGCAAIRKACNDCTSREHIRVGGDHAYVIAPPADRPVTKIRLRSMSWSCTICPTICAIECAS